MLCGVLTAAEANQLLASLLAMTVLLEELVQGDCDVNKLAAVVHDQHRLFSCRAWRSQW